VLSRYDRIIVTGTLPGACYAKGMTGFHRKFEFVFLQRRVSCEPDFLDEAPRVVAAAPAEFDREEVGFSLGGTDGSNPSPSSGESRANLVLPAIAALAFAGKPEPASS
jgi:hypothetical protein